MCVFSFWPFDLVSRGVSNSLLPVFFLLLWLLFPPIVAVLLCLASFSPFLLFVLGCFLLSFLLLYILVFLFHSVGLSLVFVYWIISILLRCWFSTFLQGLFSLVVDFQICFYRVKVRLLFVISPYLVLRLRLLLCVTFLVMFLVVNIYRQISNIRHSKCQNLNASRLVSSCRCLSLLKPCVKSRMKM